MNRKEFETLKIGDYVSPLRGENKGKLCIVKYIWDVTDRTGYREILLGANFIDPELSNNKDYCYDLFISYKAFKKEEENSLRDEIIRRRSEPPKGDGGWSEAPQGDIDLIDRSSTLIGIGDMMAVNKEFYIPSMCGEGSASWSADSFTDDEMKVIERFVKQLKEHSNGSYVKIRTLKG